MKKLTDKLFGGLKMSWLNVILFAVATAGYTAAMMIFVRPIDLSFRDIGATFECWILFAIIIMTNCKKPLESALKTFVFFLISQPLIYLFQVPFSEMGWGLFGYYRYWFIWTLLTLPMAFVGWYLKKRNWISVLILSPMLLLLAMLGVGFIQSAIKNPPYHLLSGIFCFAQIILYAFALFDKKRDKILTLVISALCVIGILIPVFINGGSVAETMMIVSLEDDVTSSAVVTLEDEDFGRVETSLDGEMKVARIFTAVDKEKSTVMTVKDGDKIYKYRVNVFAVENTFGTDVKLLE